MSAAVVVGASGRPLSLRRIAVLLAIVLAATAFSVWNAGRAPIVTTVELRDYIKKEIETLEEM